MQHISRVRDEQEEAIRSNNLQQETAINLKGGIPQAHKHQHKNAIKSFKELKPNSRHKQIYTLCKSEDRALTDRQIKTLLGYTDMNSVRPRISELIDFKYLKEVGHTIDRITRKTVRLVKFNGIESQLMFYI